MILEMLVNIFDKYEFCTQYIIVILISEKVIKLLNIYFIYIELIKLYKNGEKHDDKLNRQL